MRRVWHLASALGALGALGVLGDWEENPSCWTEPWPYGIDKWWVIFVGGTSEKKNPKKYFFRVENRKNPQKKWRILDDN